MGVNRDGASGFILFSGSNDRAVLALCRGFTKYRIPFVLIGRDGKDLLDKSIYSHHFLQYRTYSDLTLSGLLEAVEEARQRFDRKDWILCPTSEYLNLQLFSMEDELRVHSISIATCDRSLYVKLSNKSSFRAYCEHLQIKPPEILEFDVSKDQDHGSFLDPRTLELPFVAKPKHNLSSSGRILYPYLIRDEVERERYLSEAEHSEFYLEKFVAGESWYWLFYISATGEVTSGAQQNFLQQGNGKSIVMARAQSYPESERIDQVGKELANEGYRGFIMIEIRRTDSRAAIAIEANPRCWGPFQLTLDARMGLFEAFINDHGYAVRVPTRRDAIYTWIGGMVKAWRNGSGIDRHVRLRKMVCLGPSGFVSDVYARSDSWSCFRTDLYQR